MHDHGATPRNQATARSLARILLCAAAIFAWGSRASAGEEWPNQPERNGAPVIAEKGSSEEPGAWGAYFFLKPEMLAKFRNIPANRKDEIARMVAAKECYEISAVTRFDPLEDFISDGGRANIYGMGDGYIILRGPASAASADHWPDQPNPPPEYMYSLVDPIFRKKGVRQKVGHFGAYFFLDPEMLYKFDNLPPLRKDPVDNMVASKEVYDISSKSLFVPLEDFVWGSGRAHIDGLGDGYIIFALLPKGLHLPDSHPDKRVAGEEWPSQPASNGAAVTWGMGSVYPPRYWGAYFFLKPEMLAKFRNIPPNRRDDIAKMVADKECYEISATTIFVALEDFISDGGRARIDELGDGYILFRGPSLAAAADHWPDQPHPQPEYTYSRFDPIFLRKKGVRQKVDELGTYFFLDPDMLYKFENRATLVEGQEYYYIPPETLFVPLEDFVWGNGRAHIDGIGNGYIIFTLLPKELHLPDSHPHK